MRNDSQSPASCSVRAIGIDLATKISLESTEVLSSTVPGVAWSHDLPSTMQERNGLYTSNFHLPNGHELGRGLSCELGSFGFTELSDIWGDFRLYSQEMAAATMLPPYKLEWDESFNSCTRNEDPVTTMASERGRQPVQCSIPTCTEMLAGEVQPTECPRPVLQLDRSCHTARPEAASGAPTGSNSLLVYHSASRSLQSVDVALPLSSSCEPEISETTVSPSLQASTDWRSRFPSQTMMRFGAPHDAALINHLAETVVTSKELDSRQRDLAQQGASVSMSRSPDFGRAYQPGEHDIAAGKGHQIPSGNLNLLKLKQTSKEEASPVPTRKYRRRAVHRTDVKTDMEEDGGQTALSHVQRERQRRDLMSARIVALEVLLPRSPKRDRVTVVYDAIELVKSLDQDVMALQKRHHEAKLRSKKSSMSCRQSPCISKSLDANMVTSGSRFSNGEISEPLRTYVKPIIRYTQLTKGPNETFRLSARTPPMVVAPQTLRDGDNLDQKHVVVEFQIQLELLDDTVSIHEEKILKCRCRKDYLSTTMGVVNEFQLDVVSCSIMKLSGYFICIMGLKTCRRNKMPTAAQVAVRLRSMVDVDVTQEALTIS